MIEKEYSQKEKFEIEDRLSGVRSYINSIIPKMSNEFFKRAGKDKASTKINKVYYTGGTLCLDIVCGEETGLVMMNISDETYNMVVDGKETRRLMPIGTIWFAFFIYKEVKGLTEYYRNCYNKSCIRHLYSIMLNRRKAGSPMETIEDFVINHAFEAAAKIDFSKAMDEILK